LAEWVAVRSHPHSDRPSLQLGLFDLFDFEQEKIRIHPCLGQEWIPRYCVRWVVCHEIRHEV